MVMRPWIIVTIMSSDGLIRYECSSNLSAGMPQKQNGNCMGSFQNQTKPSKSPKIIVFDELLAIKVYTIARS